MMTGIDTNSATEFIENHCASGDKIFINHTVLCELVWVLKKCYKFSKAKIVAVLERVVNTSQFTFENHEIIRQALNNYKDVSGYQPTIEAMHLLYEFSKFTSQTSYLTIHSLFILLWLAHIVPLTES